MAPFPTTRLRRLRRTAGIRRLTNETRLTVDALIYPIFVHSKEVPEPIPSMPGQQRWSLDRLPGLAKEVLHKGIPAITLFGLPEAKDDLGSGAYASDGIVQRAVEIVKDAAPELIVVTDTCLDEYTSHGHCGVVVDGEVDNDATLELLAKTAISQAAAGADMVAPSDMMDGRIGAIRTALDHEGYEQTAIMAYSTKYASAFYGPFREAADCAPQFGDRRSYQMQAGNRREAVREVELDLAEGADIIMVKPALPYLDIVRDIREAFDMPLAAYNVSGEYSMVKAAAQHGWIDEKAVVLEALTSIMRAGANMVLTYHACDVSTWLQQQSSPYDG